MDESVETTDPNEEQRAYAFQEVNAIREAVSLSTRAPQPITYEAAMKYIHDIAPERYERVAALLKAKNESDTVKYFVEASESEGKPALVLIQEEIDKHEKLLQGPGKKKHLRTRMNQLLGAKQFFEPRRLTEHRLLEHDALLATRPDLPKALKTSGAGYRDYRLEDDRVLRIRLLHPDKEEAILGTDLVYEQYDLLNKRVRFVHMQYKTWSNWSINLKKGSLPGQLDRMETNFCKAGHCHGEDGTRHSSGYRMPYCSAFLRPTSPMKSDESKMVSTGDHVPVCFVNGLRQKDESVTRPRIRGNSISFRVFDELFMNHLVGSKWISLDDFESFYEDKGLESLDATIRVYAQEVSIPSEEQVQKRKRGTKG
jgi:hypothetical protein